MDWFERITGFREDGYEATRARLALEGETLVSLVNGSRHGTGRLELCTLQSLRDRLNPAPGGGVRTTVRCLAGDARALHSAPEFAGSLFQVASQFNLLEMVSPNVTPEDGVTRYVHDRTQGLACAITAGAATIFRNYFVPVAGEQGQTAARQIDALAPLGETLSSMLGRPVHSLWTMRNGYALCTPDGLATIGKLLRGSPPTAWTDSEASWRLGCITMWMSPMRGVQTDPRFRRPSVPPCRSRTRELRRRLGSRLHAWCLRLPTRRRCSLRSSGIGREDRPPCCSHGLGVAPSATTTAGSTTPSFARSAWSSSAGWMFAWSVSGTSMRPSAPSSSAGLTASRGLGD